MSLGINDEDTNDDWNFEDNGLFNDTLEQESLDESEEYEPINELGNSIVPDDISDVQVVALSLDGTTIGYRFITNVGKFDITKIKAKQYGISGIKVEKMLRLQRKGGLLLSKGELSSRQVIPDVSDCEEDCQKLFNALFE